MNITKILVFLVIIILGIISYIYLHKQWSKKAITKNEWLELFPFIKRSASLFKPSTKKCFNRIGGKPNLPKDVTWPTLNGEPLAFIAQIDLSTLPKSDDNLKNLEGYIFVFLDYQNEDVFDGSEPENAQGIKVLYTKEVQKQEREYPENLNDNFKFSSTYLTPQELKYDLPQNILDEFDLTHYIGKRYEQTSIDSCKNYDEAYNQLVTNDKNYLNYNEETIYGTNEILKFGGYPKYIQGNCSPSVWKQKVHHPKKVQDYIKNNSQNEYTFLFEIQSNKDKYNKMDFQDGGTIYVFIKTEDLVNNNLTHLYVRMQWG